MVEQSYHSGSLSERLFHWLIPSSYINGEQGFQAKVLCVFSLVVSTLGILILLGLIATEGDLPPRRLGSLVLACMYFMVPLLMRWTPKITIVGAYTVFLTILIIWYVDFNNQSLNGPITPLWIIPFSLVALLFKGWALLFGFIAIASVFSLNVVMLFNGALPDPVIKAGAWVKIEFVFLIVASIVVLVCTRGITKIANQHMEDLKLELDERKKRLVEISELKVKAEESTKSKTMFLATMSHELRTPLNGVLGNAQLLARENLSGQSAQRVNDISVAGNLLLMLINDILDFSKLEQQQFSLIEETYDLRAQLTELCRMMKSRVKPGVEFEISLPMGVINIRADKNRLAQVFMSLLSNAIKFTEKGIITVGITVENHQDVHVWVNDTGIGIKEQDLNRLFLSFSQVAGDSAKNMEGTGLGLAISKGIVEKMGGEIRVESEFGEGTRFTVSLPNSLSNESLSMDVVEAVSQGLNLEGASILVVDDIKMNCMILEGMLEDFGCNAISSVYSGHDAIMAVEQHPNIDLILMDMRMPCMTGDEATVLIREQGYKGKVIAVTANATPADRETCINAGMDDFISKPIDISALIQVLKKVFPEK